MKQSEIANHLNLSFYTIQRYRNDINMLPPYIYNPNNTEKRSKKALNNIFDNNSHHEADVKRLQMTPKDLKRPQSKSNENSKKTRTKNNLNGGFLQENIEINEHYSDKILKNNDS